MNSIAQLIKKLQSPYSILCIIREELELSVESFLNNFVGCYFNNTLKNCPTVKQAYYEFNIRDFVIDYISEFQKLLEEIDINSIAVQFRLNITSGSKIYDFSTKFGMTLEEFEAFFKKIKEYYNKIIMPARVINSVTDY